MRTALLAAPLLAAALVAAALPVASGGDYADVMVKDIPHVKQRPDFCGEACTEMVLRKLGHTIDQDAVFNQSGLDPLQGRGCYTKELTAALMKIGFKVGSVYYEVDVKKADAQMEKQFAALHGDLKAGVPSIVCMHYDDQPGTTEHFRLVIGYESKSDEIIYHEPAEADGAARRMKREAFLKLWPLKYDAKTWSIVRMRMEPGNIKKLAKPAGFTDADYARHVLELKKRLPSKDFTILIEKPFIMIGDEAARAVQSRSISTVRWAVKRLKESYFDKDPVHILDVWLFKDKESYEGNVKKLWNDTPTTPYGYYSSQHRALVMNISTGGGTLVHEIVHPFIEANFPRCPSWLNEGLGSLYEQCADRNEKIAGLTNWRLAGLQKAIKAGEVPAFKDLTGTSPFQFYSRDKGTNYAQARYLCYYLQEKELLQKFYKAFREDHEKDPTGYETLKKTLDSEDMDAFKKDWEGYVMKLKFP